MATHDIRKKISFKCHTCQSKAQCMEVDGQLNSVECLACNIRLDTDTTNIMYQTLIKEYAIQEGRNISRGLLRKRGMGRIPLTKVDNELFNPKWPFILVIEGDA